VHGYRDDNLLIDLDAHQVFLRGEPIVLSAKEFQLLAYLVENADRICSFKQILRNVWGWEYQESTDYVHVLVWHLRRKLEEDPQAPRYLLNERGVGYRFTGHRGA
jgi:two-component system KDP operon response regulator KdpE